MPFLPALALILVTLKLLGVIALSWWVVLAPLWLGIPLALVLWVAFAVFFAGLTKALR